MALSVNIPDEIAARLEARGVAVDEVAAELLEVHFARKRELSSAAAGRIE